MNTTPPIETDHARGRIPRILILGGGYVGLYVAWNLQKQLGKRDAEIAVVNPQPYMTYQPFLPEAAAGHLEPRHVVASLRRTLKRCTVISGRLASLDHASRQATIAPVEGEEYTLRYDHVVVALGAVARTLPIPGLAEQGIGFKQVEEAIALRNRILGKLEAAASNWDPELRRRQLTFTFVGGGFAGVEAIAEAEDMVRSALRDHTTVRREDVRFTLIEAAGRIMPEVTDDLGEYALEQLRERGIEVKLSTRLDSCVDGVVQTSDGDEFETDTIVWTAGMKANPVLAQTDLPLDDRGRVITLTDLRVADADGNVIEGAWAAGDCAAVPDLTTPGEFCAPTAQHAVRQGKALGRNLGNQLKGRPVADYKHSSLGLVASMGLYRGVAQVGPIKLRGFPAWFMHRTYHMLAMPTVNKKLRVVVDWTMALVGRRDVVPLGSLHNPGEEFSKANQKEDDPTPGSTSAPRISGDKA